MQILNLKDHSDGPRQHNIQWCNPELLRSSQKGDDISMGEMSLTGSLFQLHKDFSTLM